MNTYTSAYQTSNKRFRKSATLPLVKEAFIGKDGGQYYQLNRNSDDRRK